MRSWSPAKAPSRRIRSSKSLLRRLLKVESLEDRRLLAGLPEFNASLVADLNATVLSSNPTTAVSVDGLVYFNATTAEHGTELWRSDGTLEGTELVADLVPGTNGSQPGALTALNDQLFFIASFPDALDPMGMSLQSGLFTLNAGQPELLGVVNVIASGSPGDDKGQFFELNGELLLAYQDMMGVDIWKTNGTPSGTSKVADDILPAFGMPNSQPWNYAAAGGAVYINLSTDDFAPPTLVRTDGTAVGTSVVIEPDPFSSSSDPIPAPVAVGNDVFFVTKPNGAMTSGLYKTDGTTTTLLKELGDGFSQAYISSMVELDGKLVFAFYDSFAGSYPQLWQSDGTEVGTSLVTDSVNGSPLAVDSNSKLVKWNGEVYFAGRYGDFPNTVVELWKTDGTAVGTELVFDSGEQYGLLPEELIANDSYLLFKSFFGQLWKTDGTSAGTTLLADVASFSHTSVGSTVFFTANTASHGTELWKTDGTALGTSRISDIQPGAGSGVSSILGTTDTGVVFAGMNTALGNELGFSDGTTLGTYLLDVAQGTPPANVVDYLQVGGDFYASVVVNGDRQLIKTDGTSTVVLKNNFWTSPTKLTYHDGKVYFSATGSTAQGEELWRTDGTPAGTVLRRDINPGNASSSPANFIEFNNNLLFTARTAANGVELWRADDGDAGATLLREFTPGTGSSDFRDIRVVGDDLYLLVGSTLYHVKETAAASVGTINPIGPPTSAGSLMPWEDVLYFSGYTPEHGYELWRTNGAAGGTFMVADLLPGPDSSFPGGGVATSNSVGENAASLNAKLIFRAVVADNDAQLFSTDGTTAGTRQLTAFPPTVDEFGNSVSYLPMQMQSLSDVVVFEAFDPVRGRELWKSDGTVVGTQFLADLRPGSFPDPRLNNPDGPRWQTESIREGIVYDDKFYFRLDNGAAGYELWSTDGTTAGTGLVTELIPGEKGGYPKNFKIFNDKLYFTADTLDFGVGTLEGTGELFRLNAAPTLEGFTALIEPGESLVRTLNAVDPDGDALTFEIVAGLNHGTASIVNGVLTYTPDVGFSGPDVLLVRASDGRLLSQSATIQISTLANPNRISFATASSSVAEQDGLVRLTIELDEPASSLTSFQYTRSGATIAENGNSATGLVTFLPGQQSAEVFVFVRANNQYQPGNQQIVVSLQPTLSVGVGAIATHTVTIVDDDPQPIIGFTETSRTVVEDDVVVSLGVGLSNPSPLPVSVTVSLFGINGAIAGVDYLSDSPVVVTFAPGEVRKEIPIRIVEDTTVENREVISAQLSSPSGATISGDPQKFRSFVFIQDDDKSTISLSPANQLSQEGNAISITLTRTGGNLSLPLEVPFDFFSMNADWGSDVTSPMGTSFYFPANVSQATNTFNLVDDGIVDGFQSFSISLPESGAYALGTQTDASVGFYDANSLAPKISVSSSRVNERNFGSPNNRVVDVTVTLSSPSSTPVVVPIRVSDSQQAGYAKRGTDFTFNTADFVFAPGQTSLTRPLTILNDLEVESDERIRLTIGNGQFIANASDLVAEIVIEDDDYGLTFSGPSEVLENSGSFTVTARLSAPAAVGTVFTLGLGGTTNWRSAPLDVTFTGLNVSSPTLIFNQGEQTKQFTVNVENDSNIERPETLSIEAYRSVAGTLEKVSQYSVTINDDDRRPVAKFGPGNGFALNSDSDIILIPIELDRPAGVNAKLNFNLGGTARQNVDYQVVSGFAPGQLAIGGMAVDLGPNDTTAYIGIQPIPTNSAVDKTIQVTMVGAINLELPPVLPTTERTILASSQKAEPKLPVIQSGTLALEIFDLAPFSGVINPGGIPDNVTNINDLNISPFTLAISVNNTSAGLLHGSEVFFDTNFNGIRDYLDLNENRRQDAGEPSEPFAITNRDGSFAIALSPALDVDGSGVLEADEGRFVVTGGMDASTGLNWEIPLTSPAGTFGTTALSSVVESLVRRSGLQVTEAAERAADAFGLAGYSLSAQNPIYQVLAGDTLAEQVYVRQVQLAALTILASKFAQGLDASLTESAFAAYDAIAEQVAPAGSSANLADSTFVRGVLSVLNSRVLLPASQALLNEAADLIAGSLSELEGLNGSDFASPTAFLQQVTRMKKVLYGQLGNDLSAIINNLWSDASGNMLSEVPSSGTALANLRTSYSGQAFAELVALQTIGDVVPPVVGVQSTSVIEGDAGQSTMMLFEVTKLGDHASAVSVAYRTLAGSASEGDDYAPTTGTLTWESGDNSSRFINVLIPGDAVAEGDEFLKLELFDPSGLAIRTSEGVGFILDNDAFDFALAGGQSSNFVSIAHTVDELTVAENDQSLLDVQLTLPTNVTLSGQPNEATEFELQLLSTVLRADHYSIVGSPTQSDDSLRILGLLSSLSVGGPSGSAPTLQLTGGDASHLTVSLSDIDELISGGAVSTLQFRLGDDISQVTIADADSSQDGSMSLAAVGGMLPTTFNNPDGDIVLVSFHSDLQVTMDNLDPAFAGSIVVVQGGGQLSNNLVGNDSAVGSTVGELTSEDPLFAGSATFTLVEGDGDTGNNYFVIENGVLKVGSSLSGFSGLLTIRVRTENATGESVEQVFELTVLSGSFSPPTEILLSTSSVMENLPSGSLVGDLSAIDPDEGETFQFRLIAGEGDTDNASFAVVGNQLLTNTVFDFEAQSSYSIRLRVTDSTNQTFEQSFAITILDEAESMDFAGTAGNDLFELFYLGDGTTHEWLVQRDQVTLFQGTVPGLTTQLRFDGGLGDDTLIIHGSIGDDTLDLHANEVVLNSFSVLSSDVEIIRVDGDAGDDTYHYHPGYVGEIVDSSGSDSLVSLHTHNLWSITNIGGGVLNGVAVFSSLENLIGGDGDDDYVFSTDGFMYGQLDAGGGNNLIDYSGKNSSVTINLERSTATFTAGISGISRFIGSQLPDWFIAANVDNNWLIDAENAGTLNGSVQFEGFETLVGGSANDTYVVQPQGSVTGWLSGASGTDQVIVEDRGSDMAVNVATRSIPGVAQFTSVETVQSLRIFGTDSLTSSSGNRTWSVGSDGAVVTDSVVYRGFEAIAGSSAIDTLVGPNNNSLWVVQAAGSGLLVSSFGSITFQAMENATSGTANDQFTIMPGGSLAGSLSGGGGTDLLFLPDGAQVDVAQRSVTDLLAAYHSFERIDSVGGELVGGSKSITWVLDETGAISTSGVNFVGFVEITGGSATDTLVGQATGNQWLLNGANAGEVAVIRDGELSSYAFSSIERFFAGAGADTFTIQAGGSLSGSLSGGGGIDHLTLPADSAVDLTSRSVAGTLAEFRGIERLESIGGELLGSDSNTTWRINEDGTVTSRTIVYSGFAQITGGSGIDTLQGQAAGNDWLIDGANQGQVQVTRQGSPSSYLFSGVENLTAGNGADSFTIQSGGSLSGPLHGGGGNDQLLLPAGSQVHVASRSVTGVLSQFNSFERIGSTAGELVGGDRNTTWAISHTGDIVVGGGTYVGFAQITGSSAVDYVVGQSSGNQWSLTGTDTGLVTVVREGTPVPYAFSGIENLYAGAGDDHLTLQVGGSLSGSFRGGSGFDRLQLEGPVDVFTSSVGRSVVGRLQLFSSVEEVIGDAELVNRLIGGATDTRWEVDTSGGITTLGVRYTGFGVIQGSTANDNLVGPNVDAQWSLTGSNAGTLVQQSSGLEFVSIENLTGGTARDDFALLPGASLTGNLHGGTLGTNSISYAAWSTGVTVNLASALSGNATAIGGKLRSISIVLGGSGDDQLTGYGDTVLVGNAGNDQLIGSRSRDILIGGWGVDTLIGGNGEDLLLSSRTAYDTELEALRMMLAEWRSSRGFDERVSNLRGTGTGTRENGEVYLSPVTVQADGEQDTLTGGAGRDWFWATYDEELTDFIVGSDERDEEYQIL